jgi:hypothetical protein
MSFVSSNFFVSLFQLHSTVVVFVVKSCHFVETTTATFTGRFRPHSLSIISTITDISLSIPKRLRLYLRTLHGTNRAELGGLSARHTRPLFLFLFSGWAFVRSMCLRITMAPLYPLLPTVSGCVGTFVARPNSFKHPLAVGLLFT